MTQNTEQKLTKYFFIVAAALVGVGIGVALTIALYSPKEIRHAQGVVSFYPKTPDRDWVFFTVGHDVYCDDIILEDGESSLHNRPYKASFTVKYTDDKGTFANVCHLGDPE